MSEVSRVVIRRTYPRALDLAEGEIGLRPMVAEDRDAVLGLARSLPEQDLTFLRLDITQPEVVDEWIQNIELGRTLTIAALDGEALVGYVSILQQEQMWTSHIGEIRILVLPRYRDGALREQLVREALLLADEMNLERVMCQVSAEQVEVMRLLEGLGFQPQALLADWLKDGLGEVHDLVIVARSVVEADD